MDCDIFQQDEIETQFSRRSRCYYPAVVAVVTMAESAGGVGWRSRLAESAGEVGYSIPAFVAEATSAE